jgi:hypothetical protein
MYSSEPGMDGKDSNEVMDARSETMTSAVAYSVLPCDAVTNFSEATSERVSEPYEKGVAVSDSDVVILVKSVRSDDGQMSYPVSLDEIGVSPVRISLLDVVLSTTLLSACKV